MGLPDMLQRWQSLLEVLGAELNGMTHRVLGLRELTVQHLDNEAQRLGLLHSPDDHVRMEPLNGCIL